MRIALGIVKLFPEGGLQRDCIRLAHILVARGHDVTLFTTEKTGPVNLPACAVVLLPVRAYTNHAIDLAFAKKFEAATAKKFDRVIGFNKLFGLDFYYCGDPSVFERGRNPVELLLPRHRVQRRLECEAFGALQHTHILALTDASADSYRAAWKTPEGRITVLQPSIDPARQRPDLRSPESRAAIRANLGIANDRQVWLMVGAQPHVKGLDRALLALQKAPDTILLVAGVSPTTKEAKQARRVVARKADPGQVRFLGFREDIPELMAAADVLVHPSRLDVAGLVILEAIVNGLPAVVTGLCGFAEHLERAGAGIVLPEPFAQVDLDAALARLRNARLAKDMSQAGIRYGEAVDAVTGLEQAADVIEADHPSLPTARPASLGVPKRGFRHVPISVIVTTYDRPDALGAVLRGLARQTDQRFEVIVADDGSTDDTSKLIQGWRLRLRQPLIHVWQEHRGFRAAEVRNRAILASSGAYCVFLDGDCIPREDFVHEHRALAEVGWMVVGNRVLMSQQLTDAILHRAVDPEHWNVLELIGARMRRDINRMAPLLQARLGALRKIRPTYWWGARSCNLGVWRSDLDHVDGFDGSYVGWGLEDSDLLVRLLRAGVRRKDGRFATGVFHLWHPLADPSLLSTNQKLLESIQCSDRIRSIRGLSSLRAEPAALRQASDRDVAAQETMAGMV